MFSGRKENTMENKYIYKTVKGSIEVELDSEWVEILEEMDKDWKRTVHQQDRREVSIAVLECYDGRAAYEDDPLSQDVERDEEIEAEILCEDLMDVFTEKEKSLVMDMLKERKGNNEYAAEKGVDKSLISRRRKNIRKKTKSFYKSINKKLILWR